MIAADLGQGFAATIEANNSNGIRARILNGGEFAAVVRAVPPPKLATSSVADLTT
jgi:hypothetical protein